MNEYYVISKVAQAVLAVLMSSATLAVFLSFVPYENALYLA
ncbi:MAG TPA: hypothetical protein VK437_12610 [Steroidobacteraceae bacterium]|nr:hypothetical protein [Steroidobacteraceae bacterium]